MDIDYLVKTNIFLFDYEEKGLGLNPCHPANYSSINKLVPKGGIKFDSVVEMGLKYNDE